MRIDRLALFASIMIAGCADHAGPNPDPDPCGELGCASLPGTLTLTVVDAVTQQPVNGTLTFTAGGQTMPFACSAVVNPGTACPSWRLSHQGAFDVEVTAPGYRTGAIHILIEGPTGCCGTGPDTSDSLALQPL